MHILNLHNIKAYLVADRNTNQDQHVDSVKKGQYSYEDIQRLTMCDQFVEVFTLSSFYKKGMNSWFGLIRQLIRAHGASVSEFNMLLEATKQDLDNLDLSLQIT